VTGGRGPGETLSEGEALLGDLRLLLGLRLEGRVRSIVR
jgi:hypothetical protein